MRHRPPSEAGAGPRRRRTGLRVAALLVAGAALVASGWMLAGLFESPQQREAAASAPDPGDVTAQVERGDLADTLTVNGTVERVSRVELPLPAGTGPSVITARPIADGGSLTQGRPVIEVNGRPVIAIAGAFPLYRDLGPGTKGADVRALQKALNAAGYPVEVDGRFGAGTAQALARLYRALGYDPPEGRPQPSSRSSPLSPHNSPRLRPWARRGRTRDSWSPRGHSSLPP
ncbi:MAG: peptidoglycan-binding domain-containing protein [Schumannella sp.]